VGVGNGNLKEVYLQLQMSTLDFPWGRTLLMLC